MGGAAFENRIVEGIRAVGLIGYRTHDHERNVVQPACLGDGGALHLAAARLEGPRDAVLFGSVAHEGIASCHAPHRAARARLLYGLLNGGNQGVVGRIGFHAAPRHLAGRIAKVGRIDIVMHHIKRHENVADVETRIKRAGSARIHDMRHAEEVDKRLDARGRVHFSHAAAHHDHGKPEKRPFSEIHPRMTGHARVFHLGDKPLDFHIHRADDSKFHEGFPFLCRGRRRQMSERPLMRQRHAFRAPAPGRRANRLRAVSNAGTVARATAPHTK